MSTREDVDRMLRDRVKPEPFMDKNGVTGNKYKSGAYGQSEVVSYNCPREWKTEWDLIPEEQKKELVDWINSKLKIDEMLCKQSMVVQSTNPITEHLVKEGVLDKVEEVMSEEELNSLPETQDIPKDHIHRHIEAASFMEAFIHHKEHSEISFIFQPNQIKLGFVVNDYEAIHFIGFNLLHPIWRPLSQDDFTKMATEEKLKSSHKDDEHLDKMFITTHLNTSLGLYWAGILTLNIAKLSTMIGGIQNAIKVPVPRYRIEWVNTKNPIDRKEKLYETTEIAAMIENNEIYETKGAEKAPKVYPEKCYYEMMEQNRYMEESRKQDILARK